MDLLKTPSVQSLLDSDLESVGSLQYLDIEELDEIEYALPASEAPTLEEVLSNEDEENRQENEVKRLPEEPATCSALQVDFLQAVSQQVKQAQERSSAGAATALGVGNDGKVTVGTAHGQLLSFYEQTLRWVCNSNSDGCGAVSCMSYNKDSTRLLAGYARGLICQYESEQGTILRRVTLGGEMWGILRVTWAGTSGLALDTGGSVWLMKFSRPLGVRSSRTSCLFSGARGEVVTMTARDARVLALATLSRVIIVAGGRAAGLRLSGPPDTLPVVEWSEVDETVLVCARANTLQWLSLNITGTSISLRPIRRVELKNVPLWLGWLGGNLAIFDADENLRLWGDDYDKPLELSHIEPVYASAFYKGYWTDGRVSAAMWLAGASALAGACVCEGTLSVLGRRGVVRVRPRDQLARARALLLAGRHAQALRLLCAAHGPQAKSLAEQFVTDISERPSVLNDKSVADLTVKLCLKYELREELWTTLWEQCSGERAFVEALGDAVIRGELSTMPPSPDSTQALIERMAELEPCVVERVLASLPLTSIDPHRATVFTRDRGLWRAVGAIAAAIGGWSGAMVTLCAHVSSACAASPCACAGSALVLAAADALAGRSAGGRALPAHRRPSARHDALHALLAAQSSCGGRSPLRVMVEHEAAAAVRLLEQCARDPPFAGPLAKQNRLRVARHLLAFAHTLPKAEDRVELLEFLTGQLSSGALPADRDAIEELLSLAAVSPGERGDRAWLALLSLARADRERLEAQRALPAAAARPRLLWRIDVALHEPAVALRRFFTIHNPSEADVDELFDFLRSRMAAGNEARNEVLATLPTLIELRPRAAAALVGGHLAECAARALGSATSERALEFGESLREAGLLRGEAAAAHLRDLCRLRPADVRRFLTDEPGAVRPEEALAMVRKLGPPDAEPICLEAAGDAAAALDALLRLAAAAPDAGASQRWTAEAGELCARVAPTVPPPTAAAMWTRLVRAARDAPPSLLVSALAYLPAEETLEHACRSREVALALLACAASESREWEWCAREARREAHAAAARALHEARRGVPVRPARCVRCGRALAAARAAVRTVHCARACHADCAPEPSCGACGRRVPDEVVPLPPRLPRDTTPPADDFALLLLAPPRPDLEGLV